MNSQSVVNSQNYPDNVLVSDFLSETSNKLLHNLRFSYGKKMSVEDIISALFQTEILCSRPCYLSENDFELIRQNLIKLTENGEM